jgi:hypothetical protein
MAPRLPQEQRELLGRRRAAVIEAEAAGLVQDYSRRDPGWLLAARKVLGDPFARLNPKDAAVTLRLERQQASVRRQWEAHPRAELAVELKRLNQVEQDLRSMGQHTGVWMDRDARRAECALALDHALALLGQAQAGAGERRAGAPMAEPFDSELAATRRLYGVVLGEERAEVLARGARGYRQDVAGADGETLQRWREAVGRPLDQLDRDGAREALAIEKQRRRANDLLASHQARAEVLEHARFRLEFVPAHRAHAQRARRKLDQLDRQEQVLRERGVHPDQWLAGHHGDVAALAIAAEGEAGRRELSSRASEQEHERDGESHRDAEPGRAAEPGDGPDLGY